MIIPGVVLGNPHFTAAMIESGDILLCDGRVALAKMLVNPSNGDVPVRLMNLGNQPETLPEGLVLGSCGPVRVLADDDIPDGSEDASNILDQSRCSLDEADIKLPSHMSSVLDEYESHITSTQKHMARVMLQEERETFAESKDDIGTTDVLSHGMRMVSSETSKLGPRRLPLSQYEVVKEELARMTRLGVIEPSSSSWASPIVLVKKKDGSTRFCVDYRRVNNLTIKDSYPLPRIDDTINALRGSKWFSTLDLVDIGKYLWPPKMLRRRLSRPSLDCTNSKRCPLAWLTPLRRLNDWWSSFSLVFTGKFVWYILTTLSFSVKLSRSTWLGYNWSSGDWNKLVSRWHPKGVIRSSFKWNSWAILSQLLAYPLTRRRQTPLIGGHLPSPSGMSEALSVSVRTIGDSSKGLLT